MPVHSNKLKNYLLSWHSIFYNSLNENRTKFLNIQSKENTMGGCNKYNWHL